MKRTIVRIWKRCRSAVTGGFVSKTQAEADPGGTVCETVRERVEMRDSGDTL